jgi:hypothetical protein
MNVPALPTPPTDNLYKFMALSGVVLLIVAPIFWANYYITQAERTRLAFEALGASLPPPDYYLNFAPKSAEASVNAVPRGALIHPLGGAKNFLHDARAQ